jgi:hypothetical protein
MTDAPGPLRLGSRWTGGARAGSLSARMARALDRPRLARGLEEALRRHGAPIGYEVFGHRFLLCAPDAPGVAGDPDLAVVLGDAEDDLFFVAVRERGALGSLSVHESVLDAVADFIGRAADSLAEPRRIAARIANFDLA